MSTNIKRMELLIMTPKGEKYAMEKMTCLTHKNVFNGEMQWEKATIDYSFNPFGKLIKKPARILPNGAIFEHKKYYHGWFGLLICTEKFYEDYKSELFPFITDDVYFDKKFMPKSF